MNLQVARDDAVLRVTLCSEGRANTLTRELCQELGDSMEGAARDPSVRCVLLEAEGPTFCVGADLKAANGDPGPYLAALVRAYHRSIEAILTMPKPVVAAVQGAAAGGGLSLALACDVRLAGASADFRLAYPGIGMAVDGGASWTLLRLIGRSAAQDLVFRDPVIFAEEAHPMGLVHAVVPDADLPRASRRVAADLAAGPTRAYAEIKALLNPLEEVWEVLEREAGAIERTAATRDAAEGIQAFLRKERPRFSGA